MRELGYFLENFTDAGVPRENRVDDG